MAIFDLRMFFSLIFEAEFPFRAIRLRKTAKTDCEGIHGIKRGSKVENRWLNLTPPSNFSMRNTRGGSGLKARY